MEVPAHGRLGDHVAHVGYAVGVVLLGLALEVEPGGQEGHDLVEHAEHHRAGQAEQEHQTQAQLSRTAPRAPKARPRRRRAAVSPSETMPRRRRLSDFDVGHSVAPGHGLAGAGAAALRRLGLAAGDVARCG